MKAKLTLLLIAIFTLSACSQLGGTRFKRSYISIMDSKKDTVGTLFVWEADTSAAILFKDGDACMQTALAIKTANIEAEAQVSDAILSVTKATEKIIEEGSGGNDKATAKALAEISGSIEEAASLLTTTTERTAFLNMGMFYICQISANGSIDGLQANELINTLITSSAGMKSYNKAINTQPKAAGTP